MPQRRFLLFLFSLVLAFFFCAPAQSLAANPPAYEKAKAQLERLKSGKPGPNTWQSCADAFRKVYNDNPKWNLRVAALYRCGIALEERAKLTKLKDDARKAVDAYEQAAKAYPKSALADDALYRAAVVHHELLKDTPKALVHLETITRLYSHADFAKAAAQYREKIDKSGVKKGASSSKTAAAAKSTSSKSAPSKAAPSKGAPAKASSSAKAPAVPSVAAQNLAAQLGLSVKTVILDPGHGGRDPGTMHHGVVEQDINLDIAKRLKEILEKQGYKVYMTRTKNSWISLGERVRFGKEKKGDLFVSIHVNACDNASISGFESYVLDFARSSSASRLAIIENADSGRLGDMDKILTEILTGARTSESRRLAEHIQKSAVGFVKKQKGVLKDGGVKGAPFFVLVGSSMPSVLVEVGYCTNKTEAGRLKNSTHRYRLAQGIADGIHSYAKSLSPKKK